MYCPMWRPKCIYRLARISQTKPVDYRHRSMFSNIDHWPCPRCDIDRHSLKKQSTNHHDWNERRSPDLNELEVFGGIFLFGTWGKKINFGGNFWMENLFDYTNQFARPIFGRFRRSFLIQLSCSVDWNYSRTRNCCDLSMSLDIFRSWVPKFSMFCHRCRSPTNGCH